MARLELFCRIATPFKTNGQFDEEAFRIWLQRFFKTKIGVYLGSGGGGESHALTWHELQRIYEIGVEECKGKIPIYANPPEQYTARATAGTSARRSSRGVDLVKHLRVVDASRHETDGLRAASLFQRGAVRHEASHIVRRQSADHGVYAKAGGDCRRL